MALFPDTMPLPEPNADDAGFWAGFWSRCDDRRLAFQACADCGRPRHPPTPLCPRCLSPRTAWRNAPAAARVFSYTVIHHASHEAVRPALPYVVAVIEYPALPGVRLVSNVTDSAPDAVRIGMPVELWWDRVGEGGWLPRYRPASTAFSESERA